MVSRAIRNGVIIDATEWKTIRSMQRSMIHPGLNDDCSFDKSFDYYIGNRKIPVYRARFSVVASDVTDGRIHACIEGEKK